jgi:hypothetical protein
MLYMKTRVTFRVAPDLADELRALPNQTAFVEAALREALLPRCPACGGTGRSRSPRLVVSNVREAALAPLSRQAALELKGYVRLARRVAATRVEVTKAGAALRFAVVREHDVLLSGSFQGGSTTLTGS